MGDFNYPFFKGFSPWRFFIKATGFFIIGIMGGGVAIAEWSPEVRSLKEYVLHTPGLAFKIYGAYILGLFSIELLKLKVRRDLAELQWQRRRSRGKRR